MLSKRTVPSDLSSCIGGIYAEAGACGVYLFDELAVGKYRDTAFVILLVDPFLELDDKVVVLLVMLILRKLII